jgi:DNA invertase Pin-like site-specific DNA recombinase
LTIKAYSYLRFSTPEQQRGDSFRRQTEAAVEYVAKHGLNLDTELTFEDRGISAYHGKNAETGKLGAFLDAVKAGAVAPGSYLLVESLDRISRQFARRAFRTLENICEEGITVVTLCDGREYTADALDSDPTALLMSILIFMRANEESVMKGRRVRAAWGAKRQNAATKVLTSRCPGWMQLRDDRSGFDLIPDKAAVVRRIYEMAAVNIGQNKITEILNTEGVPVLGDGNRQGKRWYRSYIIKLLRKNPAVIGTYVPHEADRSSGKRVRKALTAVEGYYPAAVDPELYERVQALQIDPAKRPRGRNANVPISNVLGGIAKCPLCGGTMTRVTKGPRGGKPYLVCAAAKAGAGCQYHAVHYDDVERCLVERREEIVGTCPAGAGGEIDDQLQDIEGQIWGTEEGLERLLDAIQGGRTSALVHRVRELETALDELRQRESELHHRKAATQGPMLARRLDELSDALVNVAEDRMPANLALRSLLSSAVVDWRRGSLCLQWKHGGESELQYGWPDEDYLSGRLNAA